MTGLPPYASEASRIRYEAAQALADAAPPSFGQEAVVTGSTSRGVADEDSDIEMVFYVVALPPFSERDTWLHNIKAVDIVLDTESIGDDEVWATFYFRGIWVEAGWQVITAHEKNLATLATGSITGHGTLKLAWIMLHAVPLHSIGLLAQWQQMFSHYPDTLAQRIISASTKFWIFPQTFAIRWALIRRGEQLALTERLYVDTCGMLRILFAINHQWEPDWKWLRFEAEHLIIKPEQLVERINAIFLAPRQEQQVFLYMMLLHDVLALVPSEYDVTRPRYNVQESLRLHGLSGPNALEIADE